MKVQVDKDFSREREAFVAFLESRKSDETNESESTDNAALAKKFERFLMLEEFVKQRHEKHGHHRHGHHGEFGHHGHRGKFGYHGNGDVHEHYRDFGKHFWAHWKMMNVTSEEDGNMFPGKHGKHCHNHERRWEKHYKFGFFGKHGPYGKHGHGRLGHCHGKHGRMGPQHGHFRHHGHGPCAKHFWFSEAMENVPLSDKVTPQEDGCNPQSSTQEMDNGKRGRRGMIRNKYFCVRIMNPSTAEVQSNNTEPNAVPGTSTNAEENSSPKENEEAPQNLVSMIENIDINTSNSPNTENVVIE